MKCELLTLDLWDTVIRRKCHPDYIKDLTSNFLLLEYYDAIKPEYRNVKILTQKRQSCEAEVGRFSLNQGCDDEYEIRDVFAYWLNHVADINNLEIKTLIDDLYLFELQSELENAYLDSTIVEEISNVEYTKLSYVSDFYTKTEFIDEILSHIGFPYQFDYKFISCECGYNKRSGRLFDYVIQKTGISSEAIIHIGDNEYSDFEVPSKKGIRAVRYLPEKEHAYRVEKEKRYSQNKALAPDNFAKFSLKSKGDISGFFFGFSQWIKEICIQREIKEIYFFTREGEFYKSVFDVINEQSEENQKLETKVLEVSRVATFCPSLREITTKELMRLWNQYSVQSMAALFKSLDISKESIVHFIERYSIGWDEVITYPWQDKRVKELFEDPDFVCEMTKVRDEKKDLLMRYLAQKGLNANGNRKIAIVDIGWRGTIQDNISYLLPNYTIYGFYIGLIPFLNEQPTNTVKYGYINGYHNFNLLLKYVMPFEMICNSPNGSTVGYLEKENQVIALRKKEKSEDEVFFNYVEEIQSLVIEDTKTICGSLSQYVLCASQLRNVAFEILNEYIMFPQRYVADAFFSLRHNEEFGVGEYIDKTTSFRFDLFLLALSGRKGRSRLAEFLRQTTWPQGYLAKYHLRPLIGIYNKRYSEE